MNKTFALLIALLTLCSVAISANYNVTLYGANATTWGGIATSSPSPQILGTGSWKNNQAVSKMEFYLPLADLGTFTIDDIASLQFSTQKASPLPATPDLDFFMAIYTNGTKYGWYEERLISEPMYYNGYVSLYDAWTTYQTSASPNQMTFFDSQYGSQGWYGAPTLANLQAGNINWAVWGGAATTNIDYGAQTIKYISMSTGSAWNSSMLSYLDNIIITLTNGKVLTIDLENTLPNPVTTIQSPTYVTCDTYDVPVTVKNFTNVGAISLVMNYDPSLFSYQGVTLNPAIAINAVPDGTTIPGKFKLGDIGDIVTLPDDAVLFTLHLKLLPAILLGTTNFTWSTTSGDCEYTGPGGSPLYVSSFVNKAWTVPARPVKNINTNLEYCNLPEAVNDPLTLNGHTITVANGTYVLASTLSIGKELSIIGASEAGTIINATTVTGYGLEIHASNVSLKNFTILPNSIGGTYTLKTNPNGASPFDDLTLENITIDGSKKTAFDIHGYDNVTLTNLEAKNTSAGNGISLTGCLGVTMLGITTLNNAWGGIAVYVSKPAYINRGSSNISFNFATNSVSEFFYIEDEFGLFNTNITVANWTYGINNDYGVVENYTAYMNKTKTDALNFGATLNSKFSNMLSYCWDPTITTHHVGPGMAIQRAIDKALNSYSINVAAGTYAEGIIVNKTVDLLGPKATIDGCDLSRGTGEAIVVPATAAISSGEIFHVAASNVTIKGFTIDGDNPLLASGFTNTNSADIDAAEGVTVYVDNVNSLTVANNIFKNLSYSGVTIFGATYSAPATSGHFISHNKFQDLGTYDAGSGIAYWGAGIILYNGQYAAVNYNCMTNVRVGIQTGNFHALNPGAATYQLIDHNTIQTRRRGVFYNLHTGNPSPLTFSENTITALANSNETKWIGFAFSSLSEAIGVGLNNSIDGNGLTIPSIGYEVWNVKSNAPALINGGSVTNVGTGVFLNNYDGYASDATNGAYATITGLVITPNATGTGARLYDNPLATTHAPVRVTMTGCTLSNALEGVKFEETLAGTVGGAITGNTISASAIGINVTSMVTSATNALSITANNITLASQLAGSNPTVGILLTKITGTQAALISNNSITGPFYGYMIYNLNTVPATTITGGNITGVMQGIAALNINPATGSSFAPSTFNLDGQVMSGFIGTSANPNINFHAGVYAFTGGSGTADVITANVNNVSVTGTGNIQQDCAGLSFADFSTGTGNRQNITVTACTLTGNLNRGINVRGANALVDIGTSTLTGNGFNPYGLGGNDGFGIIARVNANVNIHNCFITNPTVTTKPVTAILTDGATILANDNFLDNNGNTTMGKLAVSGGVPMTATCNWLGSTVPATNAALVAGPVSYNPWLCAGTDVSVSVGFQGVSCNSGAPVVGLHGAGAIQCVTGATPPTTPTVKDVDGTTVLPAVLVSMVDLPESITCEGIRTYTYSFTNCSGISALWSFVYTIDHNTAPFLPANGGSAVQCMTSVTTPTPPSVIVDVCGVNVTAVPALVPYVDAPASLNCEGTRTYSWTYADCSGLVSTWNYVYTLDHTSLPTEIGGPVALASTVECEAAATAPAILPAVQDVCGNVLAPSGSTKQLSFTNKFDAPVTIGVTAAPGVWYTDRYAPAGFISPVLFDGGNRLKHSILAAQQQPASFENTQGRAYDVGAATNAMEIKLYVPLSWKTSFKRHAGFWGVAMNATSPDASGYPIVEFSSEGGTPRFQVWESGTGAWVNLGLPSGFAYDSWVTLKIRLLPSGEFLLSAGSLNYVTNTSAPDASVRLKSVILQGYNHVATDYDIYWDNFTYNDTYAPVTCEGAISYTYNYADCAGLPYAWTYIYTIDHTIAPAVPADGALTVQCVSSATTPATPAVVDVCGVTVPAVLVSTVDSPDPFVCEGTRTYNYTYTDCSGLVSNWKYVYTILHSTAPAEVGTPVSQSGGTVECVASAIAPTILPFVKDICGNTLSPTVTSPVIGGTYNTCEGTYTYTYNYVDCAGLTYTWTYTYIIDHITPPVVPANGAKTVSCPADAVAPTLLAGIVDQQQLLVATDLTSPNWTDFTSIGQSFTCGTSGKLTQLDLKVGSLAGAQNFTLKIYQGNGINGTLLYTGSHSLSDLGWQSLNIAQNVAPQLTAGQQYTFWLTSFTYNQLGLICMHPDVYFGGVAMDGCTTGCSPTYAWQQWPAYDLVFKTYMTVVPIVNDVCGNSITPVLTSTVNDPSPLDCEGTRIFTYKYEDCSGLSTDWSYVYTINYSGGLIPPANATATVSCPSQAVNPGPPAAILDACGRTVNAVLVTPAPTLPECNGTVVWRYRYTDCDGTTTADWTKTYTVTYSGGLTPPALATATVSCPSAAIDPGAPANITDACARSVSAIFVAKEETPATVTCNGTIVWRYRYTACDGTTTADWTKTYTVTYSGGLTPLTLATATVSCPADATDPGAPANISDACSRSVSASFVAKEETPATVTCNGTIVWRYRYTSCDGTTTADWTKTYTVTYSGGLTAPARGSANVSSSAAAIDPGQPAPILDACGRTVSPLLVGSVSTPNPIVCEGTVVWTYRYTACDGTTTADWTFTYTITKSTISGTVSYYNTANTPLNGLIVDLKQGASVIGTATTNSTGGYAISGICPGTYDVVISSTVTPEGGINATDAALVNSWYASSYSIEKVKFYAGDAIMSNYLHPSDATRILQHFTSSSPWSNRGNWSFWPVGEMINANPPSPPTVIAIPQIVVAGSMTQNFYGLITGDFNSSYVPGAKSSLQSLTLNYDQVKEVELGREYELPVNAGTTMEVGAVSLIMNFPSDKLEVLGVYFGNNVNNPVEYAVNGNEIRIGWQSLDPVSLKVDEQLLTLKVRAIGSLDEIIRFSLKADPLNELADGSYNTINGAILKMAEMGSKALGTGEILTASRLSLANYPNPFIGTTSFAYTLPYDGKVTLEINNVLGSKVKILVDEVQTAGDHTLTVNANELKPGVYTATLRLITSDAMLNRTIKIVRNQ